jgi:hypothetical protein
MSLAPVTLSSALAALGKAVPAIGDWTTPGGLQPLGATEGPITEIGLGGANINKLTAVEHTGGLAHQATITPGDISVSIPLIIGDSTLWSKITPYGSGDGPPDNPAPPTETGLWLVPLACFSGGAISYNGTVWAPAGIENTDLFKNSILFGRGFFTHADVPHPFDNGGKAIVTVTYTPMYDARLPSGKRGWVRGNPVAKGVSTFRV